MSSRIIKCSFSLDPRNSRLGHHQRRRKVGFRIVQQAASSIPIDFQSLLQDRKRPLRQLAVLLMQIDHQVAVNMAKQHHGAGGKYI